MLPNLILDSIVFSKMSCSEDYSIVGKLTIGFITPIVIVSTVLLHGGIVFFEKWGYDPQKRNLYNMLIASLSKSSAALVVYTMVFGSIRILFGPLDFILGLLSSIPNFYAMVLIALTVEQIIIYKILAVLLWKYIAHIDDEFCYFFLTLLNHVITFIVTITFWTKKLYNLEEVPDWLYFIQGDCEKLRHTIPIKDM